MQYERPNFFRFDATPQSFRLFRVKIARRFVVHLTNIYIQFGRLIVYINTKKNNKGVINMYKIFVNGYFVGVEKLTPSEVHKLNNDSTVVITRC